MTMLRPGEHFDGLEIRTNPTFNRPSAPARPSREALFLSRVVFAAEQLHRDGAAIMPRTIHQFNDDLPEALVADVMATSVFAVACAERGIELSSSPGLSPDQLAALAIYMDMTVPMTHAQKLRTANVTEATWRGWMRQGPFAARLSQLANDVVVDSIPVGKQRLAQSVDAGSLPAIQLMFEMTKTHDRRGDVVDPNVLLMKLFNILDELVMDRGLLKQIADRVNEDLRGVAPTMRSTPVEALEAPVEE
jgi:hypothetical protein